MAQSSQEFLIKLRAIADMSDVDAAAKKLRALADEFGATGKAADGATADTAQADRAMDALAASTDDAAESATKAADANKALAVAVDNVGDEAAQAAPKVEDVSQATDKAAKNTDGFKKQAADAGAKSKGMGLGVLEASRAFEDLQYGIRGVLNNIPTMIMSFGGGAGLAAGLSFTAVAADLLYRKLATGASDSEEAKKAADELAKSIEALTKHFQALGEARGQAAGDAFVAKLESENAALAEQKRQADALVASRQRLAALDKELESKKQALAEEQIATRERTDPNYSSAQATSDRAALERAAMERDFQEKIRTERERMEASQRAVEWTARELYSARQQRAQIEAEIAAAEQRRGAAKAALNADKAATERAAKLNAQAAGWENLSGRAAGEFGNSSDIRARAASLRDEAAKASATAGSINENLETQNLSSAENILKELNATLTNNEAKTRSLSEQMQTAQNIAAETEKEASLVIEKMTAINNVMGETSTLKQAGAMATATEADVTAKVAKMKEDMAKAVGGVENMSATSTESITAIERALADGLQPVDVGPINAALAQLRGSNEAGFGAVQQNIGALVQIMNGFKAEQQRVRAQIQQLSARP